MSKNLDHSFDILIKKINFLEKKVANLNGSKKLIESIMETFIKETLVISDTKKSVYFDDKLKKNGIFPRFLSFYYLHYSFLVEQMDKKIILEEFEKALSKVYSYDLINNRKLQTKDILYNKLQFLEEKYYINNNKITLQTIMDTFIEKKIVFSINQKIVFNRYPIGNGIYAHFLQFYFLYFPFIQINLTAKEVRKVFEKSLTVANPKKSIHKKKMKKGIYYINFQLKKFNLF